MQCDEQVDERVTYCLFHDKNYLKGDNYDKHKDEVVNKLQTKLSDKKPSNFQGYFFPEFSFENYEFSQPINFNDATFYGQVDFVGTKFTEGAYFIGATFTKEAYFIDATFTKEALFRSATFTEKAVFSGATFTKEADFSSAIITEGADFSLATFTEKAYFDFATFTKEADFKRATFTEKASFSSAIITEGADFSLATFTEGADFEDVKFLNAVRFSDQLNPFKKIFEGETLFRYTIFKQPNEAMFDVTDLSKVSFAGSDISKITFTDKVKWGGKDSLKIIEEVWIETGRQNISLDLVLYVYRRLRENYEFNLKFDEAGKLFIKEMELKRKYRTIHRQDSRSSDLVGKNNWFRKHFSLTGLYYHLSKYGESILRPTIIGIITVALSTLFWVMQSKPTLEFHFFINSSLYHNTSHFVFLNQATNPNQLLAAFQRSLGDFLPVLSLPSDIKIGIIDYITKIVGGALTFGLLIIAFRRKFERKYTR